MGLVTNWERILLEKTFAGPFSFLEKLRSQIKDLRAVDQIFEDGRFLARYEYVGARQKLVNGAEANLIFNDVRCSIEESSEILLVEVTIIYGHVSYLQLSGKYDFFKAFTIREVFWRRYFPNQIRRLGVRPELGVDYEFVRNVSDRDFNTALGYIPDYK